MPTLNEFAQESRVLDNIFTQSQQLHSKFGKSTALRALKASLLAMELVGFKFAINASMLLGLEPSMMLDILRHASARSIVSMTKIGDYLQEDLTPSISALAILVELSSCLQYPAALMRSCLSMLEGWQPTVPSLGNLQDSTNSSVLHCRSSKAERFRDSKKTLVVGLVATGLGMAISLKDSFPVVGCDISPHRLNQARLSLLSVTDDVESCLEEIDVLLFVVETPGQVLEIIRKISRHFISRYRPFTIILHTTMSASSAIEISEQLWHLNPNILCLEAPISGGPARAKCGELLMIVAGERSTMKDQIVVLEQMSSRLYYAGKIGNASNVKALHQVSAVINHVSSFEITCLGLAYGIDGKILKDILTKHAYNQYLADRLPKFLARDLTPDAKLSIWLKDLHIAEEQLLGVGMDTSIVSVLLSLFKEASEKGSPSDSDICIARCWQG